MIRVVHVLEAVGHGTGRHLLDVCRHTPDVDHHALLPAVPTGRGQTSPQATSTQLRADGVEVHLTGMRRNPLHVDTLRAVQELRRMAGEVSADIIHGHASMGGAIARLAGRGVDLPVVFTPNGIQPSLAVTTVERILGRWTTALVAVSESEAEMIRRLRLVSSDRLRVIPNGIDSRAVLEPHALDVRAVIGVPAATRVVGTVGRLSAQKRPEHLVAAARLLPDDVHVVLVGDGPDRPAVEAAIQAHGVQGSVHLLGHVDDASRLIPQFDVFALTSRYEGGPYVILEAFHARVPVVATDATGTRDVVVDGGTGFLVPPDDVAALSYRIGELLDDTTRAAKLVAAATKSLRAEFDATVMGRSLHALYVDVLAH